MCYVNIFLCLNNLEIIRLLMDSSLYNTNQGRWKKSLKQKNDIFFKKLRKAVFGEKSADLITNMQISEEKNLDFDTKIQRSSMFYAEKMRFTVPNQLVFYEQFSIS